MHLRPKPWMKPELDKSPVYLRDPFRFRGRWHDQFEDPARPFYIELGCGKGDFISAAAEAHPDANFLGVDMIDTVLAHANRKVLRDSRAKTHVRLTAYDITRFTDVFSPEDAADGLFINFANPWPKRQHHKRRLTHPRQLKLYQTILKPGGFIRFKTDDDAFFEDSLDYFDSCGFETVRLSRDARNEGLDIGPETEHERMFAARGIPIKYIEVTLL